MNGRQLAASTAVVGLACAFYILIAAGVAQSQLAYGATPGRAQIALFIGSEVLFFGAPLLIASNILPSLMLHYGRVRNLSMYFASVVLSAVFAAYCFIFNFGVADNLGAILLHVPDNSQYTKDGIVYLAPPFLDTLTDAFRGFPRLIRDEWRYFIGPAVLAVAIGTVCSSIFWKSSIR